LTSTSPLLFVITSYRHTRTLHSFPTRRSSDLSLHGPCFAATELSADQDYSQLRCCKHYSLQSTPDQVNCLCTVEKAPASKDNSRSEEHTSELQSQSNLVCRLLLEKKKTKDKKC